MHKKRYKFAIKNGINSISNGGYTPLHCAIEGGSSEAVELLIKNGADITAVDQNGETVFHKLICSSEKLNIMRLIFTQQKSTADAQERYHTAVQDGINIVNNSGYTPLHLAAQRGSLEAFKLLLHSGADIVTKYGCRTLIPTKCQCNDHPLIKHKCGAEISTKHKCEIRTTIQCKCGSRIRINCRCGQSAVQMSDSSGNTILHHAVREKAIDFNLIQVLKEAGANAFQRNHKQKNPIGYIIGKDRYIEVVKLLMRNANYGDQIKNDLI